MHANSISATRTRPKLLHSQLPIPYPSTFFEQKNQLLFLLLTSRGYNFYCLCVIFFKKAIFSHAILQFLASIGNQVSRVLEWWVKGVWFKLLWVQVISFMYPYIAFYDFFKRFFSYFNAKLIKDIILSINVFFYKFFGGIRGFFMFTWDLEKITIGSLYEVYYTLTWGSTENKSFHRGHGPLLTFLWNRSTIGSITLLYHIH